MIFVKNSHQILNSPRTSQVKNSKISLLVHQYELFKMLPNESVSDMFGWFMNIINPLNNLGKKYSNEEKIKKLLRYLSSEWNSKVTDIEEAF